MMIDLKGQPAVLMATIVITRKSTGLQETYELVGHEVDEPEKEDLNNGDNA